MSDRRQTLLIIGASAMGTIVAAGAVLVVGLASWQLGRTSGVASDLPGTLEQFLDQQIDAGYEDPVIRPDDPLLAARRIVVGHDINARTAKDVTTRLLYLDSLDATTPIDIYISTQGGWGDDTFAIIDAMRLIEAPVNTWAIGGCYSAGALILAAGTGRRIATDDAIIMVHANLDEAPEDNSFETLALARYENLWRRTSRLPADWFPMTSDTSYYLSADDALRLGIVDEIVPIWPAGAAGPADRP